MALSRKQAVKITDDLIKLFSKPGVMAKNVYGMPKDTKNYDGYYLDEVGILPYIFANKDKFCKVCLTGGVYKVAPTLKQANSYVDLLNNYFENSDNYYSFPEEFNDAPGVNSSHLRKELSKLKEKLVNKTIQLNY